MARGQQIPWERANEYLLKVGDIHEPFRFCVTALEGFPELVSFDEGMFLMLDGNRHIVRKHFMNVPKRWSDLYLRYFSRMRMVDFALDQDVSEQRGIPFVRVIDWDSYESSHSFMTNYIRPRGLRQSLSFVLFDLYGGPATAFSLDRTREEPYTERDVLVASNVVAHLNNFYKNLFVRPSGQVRIWDGHGGEELTPREREIVDLLCQGVTPTNISRELHISLGTTNKHISHIYRKFGVGSRQELLVRLLGK